MELSLVWERVQSMYTGFIAAIPSITAGTLIFLIFVFMSRLVRKAVQRATEHRKRARNLGLALGQIAEGGALIIGLLVAATIIFPDFTPASLISALGIGGIAVGFAFRDVFQNFLAGMIVLVTEPFYLGDQIVFKGYEGTVVDIQMRATTIRTYDNRRVVVPNADLLTNPIMVNTAFDRRRLEYDIGIGYGDDIARAKDVLRTTVSQVPGVLAEPPVEVLTVGFAASSVTIRVRWWIDPPIRMEVLESQDRVLSAIRPALTAHGIDMPFETQVVLFHDQTETHDGDRATQREGWPRDQTQPRPYRIVDAIRGLGKQEDAAQ